ncbi:MAG: cytochrome C [Gammaproteobacteria bacterium]|nr:cytochrome C [Gammaproteobacteria bacterium]
MKKLTAVTSALAAAITLTFSLAGNVQAAGGSPAAGLQAAVNHGRNLFEHGTFGSSRRMHGAPVTCSTCHMGGGLVAGRLPNGKPLPSLVNAAAIFPRYNPNLHRVVTLEMQIQHCIKGGLGGNPPAFGSKPMVDMVAYLHSIAKGQPVNSGGKP